MVCLIPTQNFFPEFSSPIFPGMPKLKLDFPVHLCGTGVAMCHNFGQRDIEDFSGVCEKDYTFLTHPGGDAWASVCLTISQIMPIPPWFVLWVARVWKVSHKDHILQCGKTGGAEEWCINQVGYWIITYIYTHTCRCVCVCNKNINFISFSPKDGGEKWWEVDWNACWEFGTLVGENNLGLLERPEMSNVHSF